MIEDKQPLDNNDENVAPRTTSQSYAGSTGTSIGTRLVTEENRPNITPQTDAHPADKGMSNGLARALMGGLIGATLGTLIGALANKRTAEGVNHAAKGVGVAAKSVTEGVNHAAKGVGVAVKSVAEGVNHAVIGGAADVVKATADDVKPSVINALDTVKDTAEDAKQSVVGAADAFKGAAENVKPSDSHNVKLYEERLVASNSQGRSGSVGTGEQVEAQTSDISVPLKKERLVVEPTTSVEPGTLVAPNQTDFHEG